MKIIALQSSNVKRLTAVAIKPDGSLVVIKGRNGAGKSSVIDSIAYALAGERLMPPEVIRRGQDHAEVTLDLGEFVVTRRWTANGSTLAVKSPEGARWPSPQALLDRLAGKLSFDPLAFTRAKPAEQRDTLKTLVGLDFAALDADRKDLYDLRTVTNRDVAMIRGSYARMPDLGAPDEPVSVKDLLAEQEKRLGQERRNEDARRAAAKATSLRESNAAIVQQIEKEIAKLEKALTEQREKLAIAKDDSAKFASIEAEAKSAVAALVEPDLQGIRTQLREAEGINEKVRAKKARATEAAKLAAKEAESKALTEKIDALDKLKEERLAAAKFPVEGLSFTDAGVTFQGLPLEQASSAEQLRISVAIGASLNSKLRITLVRDGSLLDEDSMRLLAETAERLDLQLWVERVGEGGEPGILIEDGAVAGADQATLPGMDAPAKVAGR